MRRVRAAAGRRRGWPRPAARATPGRRRRRARRRRARRAPRPSASASLRTAVERGGVAVRGGAQHPGAPEEQVAAGGDRARPLAAGHRVAADVAGRGRRRTPRSAREHARLHRGHVRHDGVRVGLELLGDHGGRDVGRGRDHDQVDALGPGGRACRRRGRGRGRGRWARRPPGAPGPRTPTARGRRSRPAGRCRRRARCRARARRPGRGSPNGPARRGRRGRDLPGAGTSARSTSVPLQVDVDDLVARAVGLDVREQPDDARHRALHPHLLRADERHVVQAELARGERRRDRRQVAGGGEDDADDVRGCRPLASRTPLTSSRVAARMASRSSTSTRVAPRTARTDPIDTAASLLRTRQP